MTEEKVSPYANASELAQVTAQIASELFARLLAESMIEVNEQQNLNSERFNRTQLLGQGVDQWRNAFRSHNSVRMPIEGEDQRHCPVLAGIGEGLADDLLMTEVHAIEET